MKRFQQILSTSLILIILIPLGVKAETNNPPPEKPKQSTSILQAVLSLFKSSQRRMITRGDEVCLISPGNKGGQLIWGDRPLFVWWGEIFESEINLYQNEQLVWTKTVPASTQTIAYDGELLQPGSTYDWELVSNGQNYRQTIVLLQQPPQKAIAMELTNLTSQLKTNKATKEEMAIALGKILYGQRIGF